MASEYPIIVEAIREVRGRSNPFLAKSDDGALYIVKEAQNPLGARTLINEWIAYRLFSHLSLPTPTLCPVRIADPLQVKRLHDFPIRVLPPGIHLGSKLPADPDKNAIFDFLPGKLYPLLSNRQDFLTVFLLDSIFGNKTRQAIFIRNRTRQKSLGKEYLALFIDHGEYCCGSEWAIPDFPRWSFYHDRRIYDFEEGLKAFEPAVRSIKELDLGLISGETSSFPWQWLCRNDRQAFVALQQNFCRALEQFHQHNLSIILSSSRDALLSRTGLIKSFNG